MDLPYVQLDREMAGMPEVLAVVEPALGLDAVVDTLVPRTIGLE